MVFNFLVSTWLPLCICLHLGPTWNCDRHFLHEDTEQSVCVSTAFEQKCGGGRGVLCRPGEAQRLSSLTFGCFQVRGKNPQVLTGPAPSQRTLSTQEETEGRDECGKFPEVHRCGNRFWE